MISSSLGGVSSDTTGRNINRQEMPMDKWPKCEGSKKCLKTLVKQRGNELRKAHTTTAESPPPSGEYNF